MIEGFARASFCGEHRAWGRSLHGHRWTVTVFWRWTGGILVDAECVRDELQALLRSISGSELHGRLGKAATNEGIAGYVDRNMRFDFTRVMVEMQDADIGAVYTA